MLNLKKTLILALFVAIGVSPIIPSVKAIDGQWQPTVSDAAWSYDLYDVDRLATKTISTVSQKNNVVFSFDESKNTLRFFKDGKVLTVTGVSQIVPADNRFVYTIPSTSKDSWATVYEYLPKTGTIQTIYTIPRKTTDMKLSQVIMDGARLYTSILHVDSITKAVKSKLSVYDTVSTFVDDDFLWLVPAPLQEMMDVRDGQILAKFHFDGGNKQLLVIDVAGRKAKDIPGTWVESTGDLLGAHFLSNGAIQYFQDYRLFSFDPTLPNTTPVEHKNAHLNWFVKPDVAYQIVGDRMAHVDAENMLYVTTQDGIATFGKILGGKFQLEENAVYYQTSEGFVTYNFLLKHATQKTFRVTDVFADVTVGVDAKNNVWVENTTTGKIIQIGFSDSDPLLTDRGHAMWKGIDGKWYQATLSPLLDMGKSTMQILDDGGFVPGARVKAVGNPRVYVVGNDGALHWIISETVAGSIYGDGWNRNILEVPATQLWNYQNGLNVSSKNDLQSI